MSEPSFYLWVEETRPRERQYHPMMGHPDRNTLSWMVPLDGKNLEEARKIAIAKLDFHDLNRTSDNFDFRIKHAIVYEFKENLIGIYEKDRGERQSNIERQRRQAELKKAEAEVERLKRELGAG